MIDEIDKMGADFRGDPSSAMLEVLDPAQNDSFRDHYLDLEFDLSEVLFIATANILDTFPGPLQDRMEPIELTGYRLEQKRHIARRYLVPRQIEANGLKPSQIEFSDPALTAIIEEYTREAGVRNLERQIGTICRKVARDVAEGKGNGKVKISAKRARELLGRRRFFAEQRRRTKDPGVATGLAWTPTGGDVLFIEATAMPGSGKLTITGQLGDVMKESAQAALSWVRGHWRALAPALGESWFAERDIHIHVPAGAVPKDGPSAGVALTVALASLISGRPVLAATLRFATFGVQAYHHDEIVTASRVLRDGFWHAMEAVGFSESAPPLYYALAWIWTQLTGTGEFGLRSLSALAGVATVPVAYSLGAELRGRRAGVAAAALIAVNPMLLWYSQEARGYALLALLTAVAALFLVRALDGGRRRDFTAWGVASALALATHYFAIFPIALEAAWLLWRRGPRALAGLWFVLLARLGLAPLAVHQMSLGPPGWVGGRRPRRRFWGGGLPFVAR